jgi:hypothetical protein
MVSTLCAEKDSNRPSRGRVARDLLPSAFRRLGVQRVKVPCCPISRNPEPWKHWRRSKSGPQYHEAILTVRPQETPGAVRLLAFSLITTPTHKEQLLRIPDARSVESVQGPGPQHRRESSEPSDLEGRVAPDHAVSTFRSSRFQEARIHPFISANVESTFESKHGVTAPGHLGDKESCAGGAKGTKFSYRGDHRDLQAPSDLILNPVSRLE